jgi:hypothetical protein
MDTSTTHDDGSTTRQEGSIGIYRPAIAQPKLLRTACVHPSFDFTARTAPTSLCVQACIPPTPNGARNLSFLDTVDIVSGTPCFQSSSFPHSLDNAPAHSVQFLASRSWRTDKDDGLGDTLASGSRDEARLAGKPPPRLDRIRKAHLAYCRSG